MNITLEITMDTRDGVRTLCQTYDILEFQKLDIIKIVNEMRERMTMVAHNANLRVLRKDPI